MVKLGVNIDHVATLRNARGEGYPSVIEAAKLVEKSQGDGITVHLREDRRHIRDNDVYAIKKDCSLPLNLEIAATDEMLDIALDVKPNSCCIVPEKREELTTEGGLDMQANFERLQSFSKSLKDSGILVSLFIDAEKEQLDLAKKLEADIVEFHTGSFCNKQGEERNREFAKIQQAAEYAEQLGITSHAGHGLTYETIAEIVKIPQIEELNIGHFIISRSVFEGLPNVIAKMKGLMNGK